MNRAMIFSVALVALAPCTASAWFIWIPTGAIARAFEKDPDSIEASPSDRLLGKCGGFHVNQGKGSSNYNSALQDAPGGPPPETRESTFHIAMAELAGQKAHNKGAVRDLAHAYSTRWSRVAGADMNANRAYGTDLARACIASDIPFRLADYSAWQARQEAKKQLPPEQQPPAPNSPQQPSVGAPGVPTQTRPSIVQSLSEAIEERKSAEERQLITDTESRTARRLRELDALRKSNLISDEEYAEKRKSILAEM